jgi:hypothetical protein
VGVVLIVVMLAGSNSRERPDTGDRGCCSKVSRMHLSKQLVDGSPRTQMLEGACSEVRRIGRWNAGPIVNWAIGQFDMVSSILSVGRVDVTVHLRDCRLMERIVSRDERSDESNKSIYLSPSRSGLRIECCYTCFCMPFQKCCPYTTVCGDSVE